MNVIVAGLASLLISQASASVLTQGQGGGVGSRNMNLEYRRMTYCLPKIALPVEGTDVTPGVNGIVAITGSMSGLLHFANTSTIGGLSFPSKLSIVYHDNGGQTLTCSSVTVVGRGIWGASISETFTTVSETPIVTTKVFTSVSSFSGTCGQGDNSADKVSLYVGVAGVGLPLKIGGLSAVRAINWDDGGVQRLLVPGAADSATAFDNAGSGNRVDVPNNAIDLSSTLDGSNAIADGDGICLRLHVPNGP